MVEKFGNDEKGYSGWLAQHFNAGFVLNLDNIKNAIHRASCHCLYRKKDMGRRTVKYSKHVSTNLNGLITYVTQHPQNRLGKWK